MPQLNHCVYLSGAQNNDPELRNEYTVIYDSMQELKDFPSASVVASFTWSTTTKNVLWGKESRGTTGTAITGRKSRACSIRWRVRDVYRCSL